MSVTVRNAFSLLLYTILRGCTKPVVSVQKSATDIKNFQHSKASVKSFDYTESVETKQELLMGES